MFIWNKNVQNMIDIVEENLSTVTLNMLANRLNYSPYYCTKQFHDYVGISLRNYIRLRKLSQASIDLRDTQEKIIDIAFKYGFSSQEAFTRSFTKEYGLSPTSYRRMPNPLPLFIKRNTYNPYFLGIDIPNKETKQMKEVQVSIQVLPEHLFIGLKDIEVDNYYDFWEHQERKFKRNCYYVSGILESIKSYNGIVGGWFRKNQKSGYLYGVEVPINTTVDIPLYFEKIEIKKSMYIIFHYPPYDYNEEDESVFRLLKERIDAFNLHNHGYMYCEDYPIYQRHNPNKYGQAICLPIKIIKQ